MIDNSKLQINDNSGIYIIKNTVNEKFYIGSSNNLRKRRNAHFLNLKKNKHHCRHLQHSYNHYGYKCFEIYCVEYCEIDDLLTREQFWIDKYWGFGMLFNSNRDAYAVRGEDHPLWGTHRSEEVKEKIRLKRKNQIIKHSEETKRKIGIKSTGKKQTEEHKKKISIAKLGTKAWNIGKTVKHCESIRIASENRKIHFENHIVLEMIEIYKQGFSINYLVDLYKYSHRVIKKMLVDHNVYIRNISEQKLIDNQMKPPQKMFDQCLVKKMNPLVQCSKNLNGRFCQTHWNWYRKGKIDLDGNIIVDLENTRIKYFECIAKNAGTGECTKRKSGRFCDKHANQFHVGIIDTYGNKIRDLQTRFKYTTCVAENSGSGKCHGRKNGKFCMYHYDQYRDGILDSDGNKLRELTYGLKFQECIAKNAGTGECTKHSCGRFCKRHYYQYSVGIIDRDGNKLREPR